MIVSIVNEVLVCFKNEVEFEYNCIDLVINVFS